jgi:hypothetical protein
MSSLTYKVARREILARFKAAWDTTTFQAFYDDVKKQRSKDEDPWAVITYRHAGGRQTTLSGAVGTRTFTRTGTLTVQIFTPSGKGLQEAYELAKVVSDAFEGTSTPGGAWFRNVRLNEVGRDGEFFQLNVIVEFLYDEVK